MKNSSIKGHRIKALLKKDLREVAAQRMVMIPMIIVPVILCVVIPAVILIVFLEIDVSLISGAELLEDIIPLYSVPGEFSETMEQMVYIFFNYTFIPFFMIVPVMAASIIASNGIVGEKERRTLETLLYTPLTNREFLLGKIASAFIPAAAISFIAFAGYFLAVNLAYYFLRGGMLVTSPIWIPSILLLSPGVSLLGLGITLLVSLKAKSFMEAQQIAGVVVVPFLILIIVQLTGVVVFKPLYIILFALFLFVISGFIILRIGPRFDREEILTTL